MLDKFLSSYGDSHQQLFTKITHVIGVPIIIFGLAVLLNWLELTIHGVGTASATWFFVLFMTIFYCFFDWQIALITGVWMLVLALISFFWVGILPSLKGFYIFIICFVGGWILLGIGHLFEKKKPAILQNVWQMFNAPIFVTLEIAFWFGFKQALKKRIGF